MQRLAPAPSFAVFFLAAVAACSDYTSPTSTPDVVGTYSATTLTRTANGVTEDQLALGVTLTITLVADGTTTGNLLVPAASSTPVDLTGTWSRAGTVVTFQHPTRTFIDVLPFDLHGPTLTAEGNVGPGSIRVTLSR